MISSQVHPANNAAAVALLFGNRSTPTSRIFVHGAMNAWSSVRAGVRQFFYESPTQVGSVCFVEG